VVAYGAVDVARRWAAWLLSIQRPDGSLSAASMQSPSIFNTTQAVRGWNALAEEMPELGPAIAAARGYLASQADESAEPTRTWGSTADLARQAVCWYESVLSGNVSGGWGKAQRCPSTNDPGASLRSATSHPATSHPLSQAADARARADRAMAYLVRQQRRDGGFGRVPQAEAFWTAKYFLDAALMQVRSAFDAERGTQSELPRRIDPADGRMEAVRRWFASLPTVARVADVGCGKGRFLWQLGREFPDARLTGIDVSPAMLAQLPEGVAAIEGGLLRIPAADGAFDGAFAVESLEHSLLPERAVTELCRIVRPGGRVLIIDKHAARQPLSDHEPWERWFMPEELTGWLARDCDEVSIEPVAHTEGRGGVGLFLCAVGKRRVAS